MQMKSVPITSAVLEKVERQRNGPFPPEIIKLKQRIETETKLVEKWSQENGRIDQSQVDNIVRMKLHLDGLYAQWLQDG